MAWGDDMDALASAIESSLASGTVTLVHRTRGAINTTTGVRAMTTSEASVTAARLRTRVFVDQGGARMSETIYLVKASALAQKPDADDLLIDGPLEMTVARVDVACDGRVYEIAARRKL